MRAKAYAIPDLPVNPALSYSAIIGKTLLIVGNTLLCTLLDLPWQLCGRKAPVFLTLFWHRMTLKILRLEVQVFGKKLPNHCAGIFCSNHLSYLDIVVLSSLIGGRFVSRSDVKNWPFFGYLAKRQKTVFIDRRRKNVGTHTAMLAQEFCKKSPLIIFAEGTSGAGIEVLPIKSSLLSPLSEAMELPVQPVTIHYKMRYHMPMGRAFEPLCGWYGDMDLLPHIAEYMSLGPVMAKVIFHPPICLSDCAGDRKLLARRIHQKISNGLQHLRAGVHP